MVLIYWSTVAFTLIVGPYVSALGNQDVSSCRGLNAAQRPSVLIHCHAQDSVKKCMEDTFDSQYNFCRSCQIIDKENLSANNCLCVQCALKTLESKCYKEHCSDERDSNEVLAQLVGSFGKPTDTIAELEIDSDPKFPNADFFVDPKNSSRIYRSLLSQEKRALVDAVVNGLNQDIEDVQDTPGSLDDEGVGDSLPAFQVATVADNETIWWPVTVTKTKHETETYYEISTKTKYRNNVTKTETETETDEHTKYIKMSEVTRTTTLSRPVTTTQTLNPTITQTVMRPTRKFWYPHYSAAVKTESSRHHDRHFGLFEIPDDPAPLLSSKKVVKLHNNGPNSTVTTTDCFNLSTSNTRYGKQPRNTGISSSVSANATLGNNVHISAAPQAATAMIVYTTLAVSLATSMMLAFSYSADLNAASSLSDEDVNHAVPSSSSDNDDDDDDDDENYNGWLDAEDVLLTNGSLSDQIPKRALSHNEMLQKIR